MITSVHAPEVPASLEVLFVGESCHCCGQPEPLELFKMEAILGGRKVVHKARLCSECMLSVEQAVGYFLEKSHVH